jgi:hypothetical protein
VSIRKLANYSLAALVGVSALTIHLDSAPAFAFSGLLPKQSLAPSQIAKIWFRGGWRTSEGLGWNSGWAWRNTGLRPIVVPGSAGAANAARDATTSLRPPYGACSRQTLGSNGGWRFRHNC